MKNKKKLIWPDYNNCIANLPNSILKKFGVQTVGNTLSLADQYMKKEYKNVVVFLLDGMGKAIIERHLKEDGPFRSHLAGVYQSTFLSTTVAATTSMLSGLQPCEHSWLGWECYFPQIDENVIMFLNTIQGTEKPAADYNVAWSTVPYENIIEKLNKAGKKAFCVAPFMPPHPQSVEAICAGVKEKCNEPGQKFVYAYWKQPDGLLHRNGCNSDVVHEALTSIEEQMNDLINSLEDTLFIITADHGHLDNEIKVLQDYPNIMECLVRLPSLEPRVLNCFVKEGKKEIFVEEFTKEFGDKFLLMPMEEALEKKLFGTGLEHQQFRTMLGDFLAIAIDDISIYYTDERWVSMHGSITEDEVLIPLIVFEQGKKK